MAEWEAGKFSTKKIDTDTNHDSLRGLHATLFGTGRFSPPCRWRLVPLHAMYRRLMKYVCEWTWCSSHDRPLIQELFKSRYEQ